MQITIEELIQKRQEIEHERDVLVAELQGAYRGALQTIDALIAQAQSKAEQEESGAAE